MIGMLIVISIVLMLGGLVIYASHEDRYDFQREIGTGFFSIGVVLNIICILGLIY